MKVVKDLEHGLLLNQFGLQDKYYLSIAILTFFSLDQPDQPLKEQELWPLAQAELGPEAILDLGMPKPQGEVLLKARYYAPGGRAEPAGEVSFRLGKIDKSLAVFGPRYWKELGGLVKVISDPEPFTAMDISYENAFGGKHYPQNPVGRGFFPIFDSSGQRRWPLPTVEVINKLIGSPEDDPGPAGFGPYDFTWPQRTKYLGTYNQEWLNQNWPYFPRDFDWTFFHAAPEDQRLEKAFFQGQEAITLINMHPKRALIESRLPGLKPRCFLNRLADLKKPQGDLLFQEVSTHLETVWLFPHAERGLIIHRGAAEVLDDEALDVKRLFLATEFSGQPSQSLEYYWEVLQKRLDRRVQPDEALQADAQKQMADAQKKLADAREILKYVPKEINEAIARGLGQAPRSVSSPEENISRAVAMIDQHSPRLAEMEKGLTALKAKYGQLAKIDLSGIAQGQQQLAAARENILRVPQVIAQAQARTQAAKDKILDSVKKAQETLNNMTGDIKLKDKGLDPDHLFDHLEPTPEDLWHNRGMKFVEACRAYLQQTSAVLDPLVDLGLSRFTLRRTWVGFNLEERREPAAQWGIKKTEAGEKDAKSKEPVDRGQPELVLGPGLIIPVFDGPNLQAIKIRPGEYTDGAQDELVWGSKETALVLGAGEGKPFIRVRDELEALLLYQEVGDFCAIAALRTPVAKIDKSTADLLAASPQFLLVFYPSSKNEADRLIDPWQKLAPQAEALPLPLGKDLFQARQMKVDLKSWVLEALRPESAKDLAESMEKDKVDRPGAVSVPRLDVPALIAKVKEATMAKIQPQLDRVMAAKKIKMDQIAERLVSMGIDPEKAFPAPAQVSPQAPKFEEMREKFKATLENTRTQLGAQKALSPEIEAKLDKIERDSLGLINKSEARYQEGMSKLEAAKAQAQAGRPDWAKKMMIQGGFDPDDPAPLRLLTREEVIAYHQEGRSLAGKNLTGLDLSDLDLSGLDLKKAHLQKTIFSHSILDGADFTQAIAQEADFSEASLQKAILVKCLLEKAKFPGCNLDGADLTQAIAPETDFSKASLQGARLVKGLFKKSKFAGANLREADLGQGIMSEADLSQANLFGTNLEKALLEKANLSQANLGQARANSGYFIDTELSGSSLTGAELSKAVFLRAKLDEADLSQTTARGVIFLSVTGRKVKFTGADLYNSRILEGSSLPEADLTNVTADRASWRNSDLSQADLRGSRINRGLIEECQMTEANLEGVKAKEARFTKTDLAQTDLRGLNLFAGSLRKARLTQADFRGANLYGVEFFRTTIGRTKFDEANLKMTKVERLKDYLK